VFCTGEFPQGFEYAVPYCDVFHNFFSNKCYDFMAFMIVFLLLALLRILIGAILRLQIYTINK
jgi:hypothetical protein